MKTTTACLTIQTRYANGTYTARVSGKAATCTAGGRHAALAWLRRHHGVDLDYDSPQLVSSGQVGARGDQLHTYQPKGRPARSKRQARAARQPEPSRRARRVQRADDQTTLTISLPKAMDAGIRQAARRRGLAVSEYCRQRLSRGLDQ